MLLLCLKLESSRKVANERLKQTNEDVANSFTKITPVAKSAYDSLGQGQQIIAASILSFGELAASGFESMKELAAAVRKSIADIIANFIRMYVAKALASLPLSPFMVAIAPAIAAAAGGVAKSLIMKIGAPKLAEGALAFGPTMATVGDNRNARVDPEVIAPLSKLKSMMGDVGMGGVLETRISGNDLIILDDCVTLSNSGEYEKQIRWIQQEVLTRIGPTGKLLIVGTRVDPIDMYRELRLL